MGIVRALLASLPGLLLGIFFLVLILGHYWPEMPYEQALGYLLCAGLAGMVSGALIAQTVRKARAKSQRLP